MRQASEQELLTLRLLKQGERAHLLRAFKLSLDQIVNDLVKNDILPHHGHNLVHLKGNQLLFPLGEKLIFHLRVV